eukprot:CAMPEP_0180811494 /NCGR_PEP_ID=MMETSP1038_2-20121128/65464_1 /TAXON_ID=632150 /ORGANISM="Azadinium spinosum, Strain 3D9" /LENGTH=117 /DNA_ID=CAMNT_0022852887 /DNA_START=22 /DNA_END=372 /DNA_ORIENTATION=-
MASSIEFLLPCSSYTITTEEKQIGIVVSKDMPLRVAGFKTVAQPDGQMAAGPAERSGRVRVGDIITSVNGQDISGIPRSDTVSMIACKRPVELGFMVNCDSGARVSDKFSPLRMFGK